jgi:hypothetical protein
LHWQIAKRSHRRPHTRTPSPTRNLPQNRPPPVTVPRGTLPLVSPHLGPPFFSRSDTPRPTPVTPGNTPTELSPPPVPSSVIGSRQLARRSSGRCRGRLRPCALAATTSTGSWPPGE